jgi:ABC-2 type transport system permease protein
MMAAVVYEWRRLWSVRATWVMSVVYLGVTALLGGGPLYLGDPGMRVQTWKGLYSTNGNVLCLVMLSVVASQFFGHEYRYGLIRLTLSEFPARERVLVAKTSVLAAYVTIMTFVGWSVLGMIGALAPEGRISTSGVGLNLSGGQPSDMWQVLVFGFAYCVLAMSITMITRNLALGVVLPLLTATLIEGLVQGFSSLSNGKLDWLVNALPFVNGNAWLGKAPDSPNAGLIFAAWIVGAYLIATLSFFKRDA